MNTNTFKTLFSKPQAAGETLSLAGLIIAEPLDLSFAVIPNVDFSGAVFKTSVNFSNARFSGLSWFKSCVFMAEANFSSATYRNDARFDGARFGGNAIFSRAEFSGMATFSDVVFQATVEFDSALVFGNFSLANARFQTHASFRHVECMGGLWLEGASVYDAASMSGIEVHGRTSLTSVRIRQQSEAQSGAALARRITSYGYQWL